ncbi:hypothetical protein DFP73DRAFT_545220 [Morchella snyderi]|nr:hypothetical protein DFP73DRAFT_545220 [Morchella snyderi]
MSSRDVLRSFFVCSCALGDTLMESFYVSEARLYNSHAKTEQDVFQIPLHVASSVLLFATLPPQQREKPIAHPHTHYMPCNHKLVPTSLQSRPTSHPTAYISILPWPPQASSISNSPHDRSDGNYPGLILIMAAN